MPSILIVAGPNGAGKTTYASRLAHRWPGVRFINADEIARRAPAALPAAHVNLWAGRRAVALLNESVAVASDIMLETTLATARYLRHIPQWRARGYDIELHYLRLPNAEAALQRVARRVASGGHGIPSADVIRRFARSLDYLERYKVMVDKWVLFDVRDDMLDLIVIGTRDDR